MTKDFLVIFEDDEDGPDEPFVLGVQRGRDRGRDNEPLGELDIEHDLRLGLTNTSSRLGATGFATTIVGAIVALAFMIAFGTGYPDNWFDADGAVRSGGFVTGIMVTALAAFVLMLGGTALTHYGRRIHATGSLDRIRVVQKA